MVIYLSTVTYIMVLRSIAAAQMKFSLLMNLFDIPLNWWLYSLCSSGCH